MPVKLFDVVMGSVPATLKVHLTDKVLQKPWVLDQLGEVAWTTYLPADIEDVRREHDTNLGVAKISGSVRFNFNGPAEQTTVKALYVTAEVESVRYLVMVYDLVAAGLDQVPVGEVSYAVQIVAAAASAGG